MMSCNARRTTRFPGACSIMKADRKARWRSVALQKPCPSDELRPDSSKTRLASHCLPGKPSMFERNTTSIYEEKSDNSEGLRKHQYFQNIFTTKMTQKTPTLARQTTAIQNHPCNLSLCVCFTQNVTVLLHISER